VNTVSAQLCATPFVVVATQGRRDLQGLKAALALQPQGLWFVSSAKKASVLLGSLVASGEDPAAVARIVAPAGEFIGAQTPEEIALSVLTSVVAARRGRAPQATTTAETAATSVVTQAASSCCGGAQKTDAVQAATQPKSVVASMEANEPVAAIASVAVSAKSSCCGG
jgi:xanthine dehydrogenase accessory factor